MDLSAKTIRKQLSFMKLLVSSLSLKSIRRGQDRIGELMEFRYRGQVLTKIHPFPNFDGTWIIPRDQRREGVILYLHGGGYTCGGTDYAAGFGSFLAVQYGVRVFCAAYRLAPEHPFPAAVEDVLEAYRYLLDKGYSRVTLCGESAGGGLCYALCQLLREYKLPQPCGIVAISPWTDLTASGPSYNANREIDPSMTLELLDFFAKSYTKDRTHPLVSPLFGDLNGMPPSLIFSGSDEIMRSDAELMHQSLIDAGCSSQLIVAKDRWHAYLLYVLQEDQKDFSAINRFLSQVMSEETKLKWLPLDNAAKIYPAARRQNWSNMFRLSATLKEPVDTDTLRNALDITIRRFPSIAVRLRRGVFWYYLQQLSTVPPLQEEKSYPLTRMSKQETRKCAFRVIVYKNRIALELFHSLTDGNGAMVFLKSLLAEYLQQKYKIRIPAEHGILGRLEEPSEEEMEDSYQKYAGPVSASRRERNAWQITGTPEPAGFLNLICFEIPVQALLEKAHTYKVSLTNFLCAVLMMAIQNLQEEQIANPRRRKPVKVLIPVNLRNLFESRSLRNFVLYTTPEIQPRLGRYEFDEICRIVRDYMSLEITQKQMSMKIAANVASERILAVKLMPLFLKNIIMKAVFNSVGEKKSCFSMSNLGAVRLPEMMQPYIERMDFILGTQATAPYNCGVLSYGDTLYLNVIRNIREPKLEYHIHRVLQSFDIPVQVQSNAQTQ